MNDDSMVTNAKLGALQNQRNAALNEAVALAAQVVLYQAKIKELQAEIGELKKPKKQKKAKDNPESGS